VARYKLRRPCENCPFRTDVPGYLRRERAQEIAEALANGSEFACHQTTVSDEEVGGDGSERVATPDSAFCAGALITMERSGQANQIMRVAERLGLYEHEKLDMYAPVHASLYAFVEPGVRPAGLGSGGDVILSGTVEPPPLLRAERGAAPAPSTTWVHSRSLSPCQRDTGGQRDVSGLSRRRTRLSAATHPAHRRHRRLRRPGFRPRTTRTTAHMGDGGNAPRH
jgi:hypothetical protein